MMFFDTPMILSVRDYLTICALCVLLSFLLGYFYNNWERHRTQRRQAEEREAIKAEVRRQFRTPFHEGKKHAHQLSPKVKAEILAILDQKGKE
jgi:hypothetical protein